MFVDDTILDLGTLKTPPNKLRIYVYINKFSEFVGCKVNIQISVSVQWTIWKRNKEIKLIPFIVSSKIIKYLEINLTKEVKNLYT